MPDYSVSIKLAIAGAKELDFVNRGIQKLRKEINFVNREAQSGNRPVVKNFKNLSASVQEARDALNSAALGTKEFQTAVKNVVAVEDKFNRALKTKNRALKIEKLMLKENLTFQEARVRLLNEEAKAENELALARKKGIRKGLQRGLGSAIGSGIIGGAFPLLFGQGPLSAIGGGLGGVGGGALAAIPGMAQFGFALSIAGTAIGSAMEDLTEAIKKPEDNIDNLINKLGLVGSPTAKLAKELENMGLKSSASKLLLDKFNEKLGQSPSELLKTTEHITEFKNQINLLGTEMTLFLSNVLTPFIKAISGSLNTGRLLKMLREQVGEKNMFRVQQGIVDRAHRLTEAVMATTKGPNREMTRNQLLTEFIDIGLREALGIEDYDGLFKDKQAKEPTLADKTFKVRELDPIKQKFEIEKNRLSTTSQDLNLQKENFKLLNQENELKIMINERDSAASDIKKAELDRTISKLKEQLKLQTQIVLNAEALADPFRQLSNIIAQDIGNGIKGLIQGTETLNNVLRNVLNKLADAAINMAIFGNLGGTFQRGGGLLGSIFKADGGPVRGGGSYIVGERGPELFTPGISGMITPNNALGGAVNVSVNVDASGSSVQGDENRGKELGLAISAAVQSEIVNQKRPGGLLA